MTLKLDRLQRSVSIVDSNGLPSSQFQRFWQGNAEALEESNAQILEVLDQIASILGITEELNAAIAAAQDAADSANSAAADAQTAADTATAAADTAASESALATSGTTGLTITATDAGSSVTVAISAHTRIYGNGASVAVSAGNVTGLSYSTTYYLYYSDPARAGGSVTFLASTSQGAAAQTGDIHSLGAVATPAAAAPPTDGRPNLPPGVNEP